MLVPVDLPPGVYRNGTAYQSAGRYYDADLIRFHAGKIGPVGGWRVHGADPVSGKARAILSWVDNTNQTWAAVGTHTKLYAMTRSGVVHDITPSGLSGGQENASLGSGYGSGTYGSGTYGTPRPDGTNIIPATVWSLDTIGENLVACFPGNETIYLWELDTASDAATLTDAPSAVAVVATEERAVMALGADDDPRRVAWSDAEDITIWTAAAGNLAGGTRLQTFGKLQTGKRVRGGILIFTDVDVHLSTYVGLPKVYGFERLATDCGIVGPGAVAVAGDRAIWMGKDSFWVYDGVVNPLPCDLDVFERINGTQSGKTQAVHISAFNEVWFLYPSSGSTEIDSYAIYNYREEHWTPGSIARTCGVDKGVFAYPLMVGTDGEIYDHEVGHLKDARQPYLESGPFEIGNGDRVMLARKVIPDEAVLGDVALTFYVRDWPMSSESAFGPYTMAAETDVLFSARQARLRYVADADQDFRVGSFRADVKPQGFR